MLYLMISASRVTAFCVAFLYASSIALPSTALGRRVTHEPTSGGVVDVVRQKLEDKLELRAAFAPKSSEVLEQLIEVGKRFDLPMGIEWIESIDGTTPVQIEQEASVREILDAVLRRVPGCQIKIENGMLHIIHPAVVSASDTTLDLRLPEFKVDNQNVFTADHLLRLKIDMTLHPEQYEGGYIADFGYPPGHIFDVPNITLALRNVTVREVLNRLAAANGNAMWVARSPTSDVSTKAASPTKNGRSSKQFSGLKRSGKGAGTANDITVARRDVRWNFIPLSDRSGSNHQ